VAERETELGVVLLEHDRVADDRLGDRSPDPGT
jgi:hypothetical protein